MRWNTAMPLSATYSSQIQIGDTTKLKETMEGKAIKRAAITIVSFRAVHCIQVFVYLYPT